MRYIVLLFLFHVAFGDVDSQECPLWANQPNLGKYQVAWKTLRKSNGTRYFLVRSTNNSHLAWGKNFTCVNARAVTVDEKNKTVQSFLTFKNGSGGSIYNFTGTLGVAKTYGYNIENAIQFTLPNGTSLSDPVIFSDYKTCMVLSVPFENDGAGCELWVNKDHLESIPDCCNFIFDAFCVSAGNYTVYDKINCTDVLADKKNEGC